MSVIHDFLRDLDRAWTPTGSSKVPLRIIGSTALMLQASYARGTKDSDVLETVDLDADTRARIEAIAGKGSKLHARHKLYVDIVSSALPFLARAPQWSDVSDLNANLTNVHVHVLEIVDVVVSKLKRFHAYDLQDIEAMVDRGLVDHGLLVDRFREAVEWSAICSAFLRRRLSCLAGSTRTDETSSPFPFMGYLGGVNRSRTHTACPPSTRVRFLARTLQTSLPSLVL